MQSSHQHPKTSPQKNLSSCGVLPHSKGLNIHRQLEEKNFYQPRWAVGHNLHSWNLVIISGKHRQPHQTWNRKVAHFDIILYLFNLTNSTFVEWQLTFWGVSCGVCLEMTPRNTLQCQELLPLRHESPRRVYGPTRFFGGFCVLWRSISEVGLVQITVQIHTEKREKSKSNNKDNICFLLI